MNPLWWIGLGPLLALGATPFTAIVWFVVKEYRGKGLAVCIAIVCVLGGAGWLHGMNSNSEPDHCYPNAVMQYLNEVKGGDDGPNRCR
jgi:hypothetical protein